jgi:hypothetical protein
MNRRAAVAAAIVAVVAVGAVAAYGAFRARVREASHYVAPPLVEPAAGPRAPSSDFAGVRIGVSRLADAKRLAAEWKLACADRSMRTLMTELRDRKRAEVRRAQAQGAADAVSGASILERKTARDENPQVRLSCDDVASNQLRDRPRTASKGRVLFVFDGEGDVVRHASYQRHHGAWEDALADFDDTKAAFTAAYGPGKESGSAAGQSTDALPKYGRRAAEWRFADLVATLTLVNLGGRGYSLSESVEVPYPVRADAPGRK